MLKPVYFAFVKIMLQFFCKLHFVLNHEHIRQDQREKIIATMALRRAILMKADPVVSLHSYRFTGEQCLRMRREINHVVDIRQSHWLRGKIPAKCCRDERRNGSVFFFPVVVLWFCCHCERSEIILVEIFSDICCLVTNASLNCQTNTLARSI